MFTKGLEIYGERLPSDPYSIGTEVDGLVAALDGEGIDRCYLYGHSAGGAIALAFVAEYPDRILGLAIDEPASDFSDATKAAWPATLDPVIALPVDEQLPAFLRAQVAAGVELPAPPPGPQPEWMALRPAGLRAFMAALAAHDLPQSPPVFERPVYYSYGSRTNPLWRGMRDRLAMRFPSFTSEEYEGLHHLNTSHAAEPARVAGALRRIWQL